MNKRWIPQSAWFSRDLRDSKAQDLKESETKAVSDEQNIEESKTNLEVGETMLVHPAVSDLFVFVASLTHCHATGTVSRQCFKRPKQHKAMHAAVPFVHVYVSSFIVHILSCL